jgi:hypothetical protein
MTTMVPLPPIGGGTNKNATITTDIGAIYRYDNQPKLIGNDHEEEVWQEREWVDDDGQQNWRATPVIGGTN